MIITDGLITGTMPTHGYGALAAHVEHVDVAFSLGVDTVSFALTKLDAGDDEVSISFALTQLNVAFSFGHPYGLTEEGEDIFAQITMKYPED